MNFWQKIPSHWLLLYTLLLGFLLGIYNLDTLPAEMWGDAVAHYILADQMKHGVFFYDYRFGGDGPIFTYLVVLMTTFLGLSFYTLKFTSVIINLFFIATLYFLTLELFKNKRIAYIASFLSAVSFWSLTFARQPHARMLVPLFITITVLLAVKKKNVLSGIFLGLGMYTQASIWTFPITFFNRLRTLSIGLLLTLPLIFAFHKSSVGFFTNQSYFGRILGSTTPLTYDQTFHNIFSNLWSNALAFTIHGDQAFRMNVPGNPHLDQISGIFFLAGFILLLYTIYKKRDFKLLQFVIVPFFIIQIPSILDIHDPQAQPNIGRMIGTIPFVFMITAYGLDTSLQILFHSIKPSVDARKLALRFFLVFILLIILTLNIYKYFFLYPQTLPNHNVPFGKIIAARLDQYPATVPVILLGGGWGEWSQPEQYAIVFMTKRPHPMHLFPEDVQLAKLCEAIKQYPEAIVVANPEKSDLKKDIQSCSPIEKITDIKQGGYNIAQIIQMKK